MNWIKNTGINQHPDWYPGAASHRLKPFYIRGSWFAPPLWTCDDLQGIRLSAGKKANMEGKQPNVGTISI